MNHRLRLRSRALSLACLVSLLVACTNSESLSPQGAGSPVGEVDGTAAVSPDASAAESNTVSGSPSNQSDASRLKVFFPKQVPGEAQPQYVEPVWRATNDPGVAKVAIAQLLAGPSEPEMKLGLEAVLPLTGASNCQGEDFQIAITARVAELQFCRELVARDAVDMTRLASAVEATLTQFPTVDRAVMRDRQGKCLSPSGCEIPTATAAAKQNNPPTLNRNSRLTLTRLGPLAVGMTLDEAAAAADLRFVQEASGGEEYGCLYFKPAGGPDGISLMAIDGEIARIDIDSEQIATQSGVRIGDSAAKVRQVYGDRLESQPHEYVPGGEYLIFVPTDAASRDYRVVFETNERGIVTRMRNGLAGAALAVEGCV